ncbi:hypothetical protein [uncultured Pseudomonas sp.]|uniref:hypothetical protein n=1 Tax=uncultured Pseudomonas sp. TaxID=114707 RepID=UPI00263566C1|nr:hypothetical protein [uncultured Pseudomonas sp.]
MPSIRSTLLLLALLLSAACEQTANPPAPAKPEAVTVQPVQAASDNSAAKAEPKKPALRRAEERAAPAEAVQSKPKVTQLPEVEPAEPNHPLDLKLRPNVFDPLQPVAPLSEESTLLPPLFTEKVEPDSPFQLNGKLISNERDGDYWQSIEGAQLQFEFKQ